MQLYQALITLDGWTFLAQICNLMIQLVIFKKLLLTDDGAFAKVQTDKRANARTVLLMKPSINKNNGTRYFFILRRKKLHAHESLFLRPNSENDVFLVSPPSR